LLPGELAKHAVPCLRAPKLWPSTPAASKFSQADYFLHNLTPGLFQGHSNLKK
jgi:hypothetical protein